MKNRVNTQRIEKNKNVKKESEFLSPGLERNLEKNFLKTFKESNLGSF